MSHDKTSGTATRKERRKAKKGEHQATARARFTPADYVRNDWTIDYLADRLESRARGYNGRLREFLCTAAARLRISETALIAAESWMIPGMDWTDETGQLIVEMVREAIAKAPEESHVMMTDEAFDEKIEAFMIEEGGS